MDTELFALSAGVSGAIGSLAPFVLPSVFKLLGKIFKRDLSKEEKRLIITLLSGAVALTLVLIKYQWVESFEDNIGNLLQFFFVNFVAIKGMVQTIYELIIKSIPALEERFS